MSATGTEYNCPKIVTSPSRFRTPLAKYLVSISPDCTNCGVCVSGCPQGVLVAGGRRPRAAAEYRCIGGHCGANGFFCVAKCPEHAITIHENPSFELLGDRRWTPDLLASTWYMAETGDVPPQGWEYKVGDSGGGFDKLRLLYPPLVEEIEEDEISTSLELNRSGDDRPVVCLPVPWYLAGMSYGSVGIRTLLGRVQAATAWNTFCCTGEGGYPDELKPYDDHVITQVATGLFGIREETIQRVRIVEFKYAQGAKPGLGGHLLGDKVTPSVARMREAVTGSALFSPFPFHSVYSVEDHRKHVDWIKEVNPRALVAVKVSTPNDVDMVAVGSYFAGAHIIQLDGTYGGTGAAPDIAKKNIAMPIEYAVPKVHKFLLEEGIRDRITVIASGGIRTAYDVAKIIALGADGVSVGTADLVALECIRCHHCESGRGCARGIATTDEHLGALIELEWATQRIVNMYHAWRRQLVGILKRMGMKSVQELTGRWDVLVHSDYADLDHVDGELD